MNENNTVKRHFLIPMIIVVIAILAVVALKLSNKPAAKKTQEKFISQVQVETVHFEDLTIPVLSQGVVTARTKIRLLNEVPGKIVKVSKKWVNGGFFKKGETLLQIEDYVYQNQLAKARANVASTKSALVQEQGYAYVAKQDWERRHKKDSNPASKALALREPQLASAKTQYEAAKADVTTAKQQLFKTTVKAPYDGLVSGKEADVGQYISTGQLLAEFHAIDYVEIRLPLTGQQLGLLDLPAIGETSDIPVRLALKVGDVTSQWIGQFVRTEGILDEATKVLYGVVEIQDPYGLNKLVKKPLRIGSFVEATIESKALNNVVVLPRNVLRAGNILWLVDENDYLMTRRVITLPTRGNDIFVVDGLNEGERVVIGGIAEAVEGRQVKIQLAENIIKEDSTSESE